ncbi:DNA-binding LytR/AlgR family response regulator [Inhella inkyongensis]|uniref:DNA-binding LytR/AlgR family response regulator n=1 Tax=Inhella inkyongensis TaxID=392593 RepID=A0A840S3S3_9BURK|nr:LytTR family DNA-binding domain-containing protein [Inhella inkyongensis]MBB5204373.1 DNA-binding LytR/AlgR family response regulator [Inhella inkyongensis]
MKPPTFTAVVAEDEDTLRQELIERLGQVWPELRIVAEAADGLTALRLVAAHRPSLVFLDIEMPGLNGLELARQLGQAGVGAQVVFVTAYDAHAIEAFEAGAHDYLLKPLSLARLLTTVTRLQQRLLQVQAPQPVLVPRRTDPQVAAAPLRWINASVGATVKLLTVDEVLYFQADTKYTRVVLADAEALIRKSLKELVDELDPQQFWQIHRSTLVNLSAIASASRDLRGRLHLRLKERPETLLVAESYAHRFKQM